jgi:hypothetical protein
MGVVQCGGNENMIVRYVEHSETYIMHYRADLGADPRH